MHIPNVRHHPLYIVSFVVLAFQYYRVNPERRVLNLRFCLMMGAVVLLFTHGLPEDLPSRWSSSCSRCSGWACRSICCAIMPPPRTLSHADQFHRRAVARSGYRRLQSGAAHLRALRPVHRDLPDLPAARRRTRQSARAHLPDQGHAGDRAAGHRGRGAPCRSLSLLPRLHDHLSVRRELHAPGGSRAQLHRADLSPAVARARIARRAGGGAAATGAVSRGAARRARGAAIGANAP